MVTWNPKQYLKFADERTQGAIDLASKIRIDSPGTVIDIGCGPGNSTRVLRARWPNARIVGLDSSPEMIARARLDFPEGQFLVADAAALPAEPRYDVIFSNAVLQWIPNYEALLPRLFGAVAPGGCLAAQVPANSDSPLHQALLSVAANAQWSAFTGSCAESLYYRTADDIYAILSGLGRIDLWETTYYHVMASHQDLLEWYRGTAMRPFLEKIPTDSARSQFEAEVLEVCRPHYPLEKDGKVLFPFKRIFFVVYR